MRANALFAHVRRLHVDRVVVALWLSTVVVAVWPATLSTDNVKLTPITIQNQSSPSLPPEVQTLESQTAPEAFDRDTTSEHTAYDGGHLIAILDAPTEIRTIKVFGPAPYTMSVDADASGTWSPMAGLQNVNLTTRPASWNAFAPTSAVTTGKLRFTLTSATGGSAAGIKGIEIWGKGGRVNLQNGAALLTALLGTTPPTQGRIYRSTPAQGVIGAVAGATDDPSDNTFTLTLDRNPADYKRVYLSYSVLGLSSWVHAVRSINGGPVQGGFALPSSASWTQQIEEVNPQWLVKGANTIAFSAPAGSTGTFTVKDVFLIAELESGGNFVSSIADNMSDPTNPEVNALDGDLTTGWTPYPNALGHAVTADVPTLALNFDKTTQIEGVALYLSGSLKGNVDVQFLTNGAWVPSGAPTVAAKNLVTGWNSISAPSAGGVDGVQLVFSGGKGSNANVIEVVAAGSGVGPVYNPPRAGVSFPDAGQFYARTAYIRGFLQPLDDGSGAATLTIGGKTVTTSDGAFGVVITKDDMGLVTQGDSETWSVDIQAVYPDGKTVVRTVTLNNWQPAVESTAGNLLPTYNLALPAGQAQKMSYDAATLDVPTGSTTYDVTIGMTPLSDVDLPALDAGMTNVTKGPRRGFRFTPHPMKFAQKIKVTLPYNKGLIPPGKTEQDVKTFYFDDQAGSWKVLEMVAIDPQANTVTSYTDHFTDMINATVTVPDHPEAASFNPTQIKDIKAADPGSQVNLIEAPKADNTGDARLSYPVEVPPGRQGMQPQLAVTYGSAGGNGWMGMGWDMPMQAIVIDTRWGVPRYDANLETETYTMRGEMLTPVAHRGDLVARTTDKVFHARVEGEFKRIIRRGSSPSTYTWEVTDKNGVQYLYGATDPATETLTDASGNIFLWALCKITDPNGNFVRYHYAKVSDPGVPGGSVPGSNIYVQTVTYTGSGVTEGPYAVTFFRDRDFNEARRVDVQIDARGGFKRVTADLLRRIEVSLSGQLIRRYDFSYNENPYGDNRPGTAFNKTLLTSISQSGADASLFNKHTFLYNDEARDASGNYRGFAATTDWTIGDDGIGLDLLGQGTASALGGSQNATVGGHLYIGFGTGPDITSKVNTAGPKFGFSVANGETLITMADMDGDGLPDKVFRSGSGVFYRKNLSGPNGSQRFADVPVQIQNLGAISHETVTSVTVGAESYFGLPVMVDVNRATTQADTYFADVNGDGITDLVSNGQVLFGFVNAAGVPVFSANSADTPVPVGLSAIDTTNLLEDASALVAERAQQFPLLDTLRRWVAPYDGTVNINAPVHLIQDTSAARAAYTGADGVRVAIQLEGSELWFTTIGPNDFDTKTPTGVTAVPVHRGDRLYFRVQSVFDGAFDQVAWDPQISYTGVDAMRTDVNNLAEFNYQASGNFTLFGRGASTVTVPLTGTLHLAGTFAKNAVTTDDVKLVITRNGLPVFQNTIGFAATGSVDLSQDLVVTMLDVLQWQILVDSPIDATAVALTPSAFYTAADGVTVTDNHGNFVVNVSPTFDMDLYPVTMATAPQDFFTAPNTGTFTAQARIDLSGLASGAIANAAFTVKRRGALLAKTPVVVTGTGAPVETIVTADFSANAGDQVFFDLSSRDPAFAGQLTLLEVTIAGNVVPSASHTPTAAGLFPQPYRGFGAAGYNGNPPRDAQPINQTLLVIDQNFDPNNAFAYPFLPQADKAQWGGIDDNAWVKASSASSSRLGLDDLRVPTSAQFAGQSAPARISRSDNLSVNVGVAASAGNSQSRLEFQDLNGDRFPDVISASGGVQFSRAAGGLEAASRGAGPGSARSSDNQSITISTDGAGNIARAISDARGGVSPSGVRPAPASDQSSDMPRLGFGGDVGAGTANAQFDLIDINGDGLPDKVFRDGTASLNLGYSFAPAEPWGGGVISDGITLNAGVNAGFNLNFYSIAGGLNLGVGDTHSDETYTDINGDGLPDKIVSGSPLTVRLNTGTGFTGPIAWPGGQSTVAEDKHISLGGGVYFTFGFTFLGTAKVVVNPGIFTSASVGRPEISFRDVDGDNFADQVFSTRDSQLSVSLNPIGRTNLLKKVHRPLGATIDLEYTRDGNTFDQPQSRWLMTRVTVFDGHVGEGADRQMTSYVYSAPKYNRLEREFYGYSTVIEQHLDTQNANALFRTIQRDYVTTSYYTKGLLARELTADALARPFAETQNTYVLRDVNLGIEPADPASTTATEFPQLTRTDKRFFEGGTVAQKATATLQQYDALGNLSGFTDTGDVGATDDAVATISYSSSDPACQSSYIVGKANKILVTGNGVLMRDREATIDCTTGNVTQVRQLTETGAVSVTDLAYFPNGNIQTVTGPTNKNGQRYSLSYLYDPTVNTHVAQITDSFGLFSNGQYDLRFGKPTITADINGQKTTYAYDTVGRVDNIVGPYEQGSTQLTIDFTYAPVQTPTSDTSGTSVPLALVPFALTQHIDKDANGALKSSATIDTILFTDGLKRIIQNKKDIALSNGPSGTPADVVAVSGQISFDAFGRMTQQFYPTTELKGTNNTLFNTAFDAIAPTTLAHDVLDRNVRTTIPDGTTTNIAYGFGTDRLGLVQFQTTVTDAKGKIKQTYRDVRTLVTSVKDFNQGTTLWTSYTYDALRQMVGVEDDHHNVTNVMYDNLGRRTVVDSPDLGRMETQYDPANNVVAKITANLRAAGQQITYNYDFNRLAAISYPNFPGNNVTYAYGAPSAAGDAGGNRAGRITHITSQMGSEDRSYGRLGEVITETKTIFDFASPATPVVYTTQYQYDTWNRLMRLTYPDGEVLTYGYDSGGLVNSAQGVKVGFTYNYLNRMEYDKFEQRVFMEVGNKVQTQYAYDAKTRRMCGLTSAQNSAPSPTCVASLDTPPPTQQGIQNLSYAYDAVGNILGIANSIPVPPPSQFGGPTLLNFVYDDLYRLTSAAGTYSFPPNKTQTFSMIMAYDSIHNIASKNQNDAITQPSGTTNPQKKTSYLFNYAYGSTHPHAPTHIGERTFTYDANGNQLGWTNDNNGQRRNIVWDDENRIQSIFDNGDEHDYKYDDQGNRALKKGPGGESIYPNQYFTGSTGDNGTKHVFIGRTRLVSKLVKVPKPQGNNGAGQGAVEEKDLFFFHPDHLGSSNYVTDTQGKIFEHMEYFPYGETWVQEASNTNNTPFLFTDKEFDQETGLYYYGARYYDPRTSVWQNPDPAFSAFLPHRGEEQLPGLGGVYNSPNLGVYGYAHLNPVKINDPNGESATLIGAVVGGAIGAGIAIYRGEDLRHVAGAAAQGAIAGAIAGSVIDTGGASLGVIVAAGAVGNTAGGIVGRAISGDQQTAGAVVTDAAVGAAGALLSVGASKLVGAAADRLASRGLELCSFGAGTVVVTRRGLIPIEQVVAGDEVLSRDMLTGEQTWQKVLIAYNSQHRDAIGLKVSASDSGDAENIVTTSEHPFFVRGQGWTIGAMLRVGDLVESASGNVVRISGIEQLAAEQLAYNMQVAQFHTYFVGRQQLWVHNACDIHHLATNKNYISTARGGPWSPRLEPLFKKAGMTMEDVLNKVQVAGHAGPHPEAYHQAVFDRLVKATEGLSGEAYTKAFQAELTAIGQEAKTSGTLLNQLITKTGPAGE
jgi:RHS repeat-associated protein